MSEVNKFWFCVIRVWGKKVGVVYGYKPTEMNQKREHSKDCGYDECRAYYSHGPKIMYLDEALWPRKDMDWEDEPVEVVLKVKDK